jgi:6-pyruvoyltetrahydropterin/6-carboxytetrahydropterin synthase
MVKTFRPKHVTIAKQFTFEAAHRLDRLPASHKCHHLHGHSYRVEVQLRGPVDENGFVVDYADIAAAWRPFDLQLDHKYLNDIPGLEIPSTEVLVKWIGDRLKPLLPRLIRVRVSESMTTWAEMEW